jgi:calcineurin-like phosphoesterase family protein
LNYWFTSDWHLSHKKAYELRSLSSKEHMDSLILDNFFEVVRGGDQVYFLGDLTYIRQAAIDFFKRKQKNIHFHFILGNHDKKIIQKTLLEKYCAWYGWLKDIKIDNQKITLCHYMMNSWNCSHWNAWHLFGHHHSREQANYSQGKTLGVAVDLNNYYPLSFDQIKDFMNNRPNNWDYELVVKRD